ncbi:DUF488 domain-containing protein, partial [Klebsiella pneumoniae]
MIQCKRVYDPQESSDGYRVLVDRLWPRGIKKEALACDEWCKELTPSAELRKAFHGEAIDFAHFSQRYRQELDAHRETGLGGGGRGVVGGGAPARPRCAPCAIRDIAQKKYRERN